MILIGVGSSLSFCGRSPQELVGAAIAAVGDFAEIGLISSYYTSPAWPDPSDPPFVNAVFSARTSLAPGALLEALHAIEAGFGRERHVKNAPRTLDLDLLDYGGRVEELEGKAGLILPHPRIAARDFVLLPLQEIAPDWVHPLSGLTAAKMLLKFGAIQAKAMG